jgi:hypothetical protein
VSKPGQTPQQYSTEFKQRAVLRPEAGEPALAVAGELGIRRKLCFTTPLSKLSATLHCR